VDVASVDGCKNACRAMVGVNAINFVQLPHTTTLRFHVRHDRGVLYKHGRPVCNRRLGDVNDPLNFLNSTAFQHQVDNICREAGIGSRSKIVRDASFDKNEGWLSLPDWSQVTEWSDIDGAMVNMKDLYDPNCEVVVVDCGDGPALPNNSVCECIQWGMDHVVAEYAGSTTCALEFVKPPARR